MRCLAHRTTLFFFIGLFSIGTGVLPVSLHYCGDQLAALSLELFDSEDQGCCSNDPCQPEGNCCSDRDVEITDQDQIYESSPEALDVLTARIWPKGLSIDLISTESVVMSSDDSYSLSGQAVRVRMGSLTFYG